MDTQTIPAELRARKQWLAWYYDEDGNKIPVGKTDEPSTWCFFADLPKSRIAYVISADDPYTGVDFDNCVVNGEISDTVLQVLEHFRGIAYAEISPSGTGVKLTTRGKKPDGVRCQDGKWLECYDHKRFWAMTGQVLTGFEEIGNGQEAVNWLCRSYLAPQPASSTVVARKTISTSLEQRAQSYVDNADAPSEGGRNNSAFRLAGHLAAIVGDCDDRLSTSDIQAYLEQWNSRMLSPLSEKELAAVVASAMKNGTPRDDKHSEIEFSSEPLLNIDWERLNQRIDDEEIDDEDFCQSMIPPFGLLRLVYDFYGQKAFRHSHVMGLSVAVSFCEMLFGRRIRTHTDMRTNDFNLIIATTGAGKEACEATVTQILDAADVGANYIIPPDVQSGNGLMKAINANPCAIWVCDEFGKILQAVLDKKGNQHIKNIGNHLLKLYGKSNGTYGGAAHSDGIRNRVIQPHLCILGLSTGSSLFESISTEQVSDGLIGRIAFWPVQDRPVPRYDLKIAKPSEPLIELVKQWMAFEPGPDGLEKPTVSPTEFTPHPETVTMSDECNARWIEHSQQIDSKMRSETELRAAIWSRVAARSMKLALVHRAARLEVEPKNCQWDFVQIEIQDVQWGITLSNWLARSSCGFISENVYDKSGNKAKTILQKALESKSEVSKRDILRAFRSLTAGDLQNAADELGLETVTIQTGGRPAIRYRKGTEKQAILP